jgi:hypothetical protein
VGGIARNQPRKPGAMVNALIYMFLFRLNRKAGVLGRE